MPLNGPCWCEAAAAGYCVVRRHSSGISEMALLSHSPCSPSEYGPGMRRRELMLLLGGAASSSPLTARAQHSDGARRIGVLHGGAADDPDIKLRIAGFLQALQQSGWTDGNNLRIDYRWSGGNADDIRKYAAELVALAPDAL